MTDMNCHGPVPLGTIVGQLVDDGAVLNVKSHGTKVTSHGRGNVGLASMVQFVQVEMFREKEDGGNTEILKRGASSESRMDC